jgi:hypothetical protein
VSTTALDLVNETLNHLHATHRDPLNKLNGSLDTSTTTVTLTYDLASIATGALISIDLELMYVWEVQNAATKTVTVQRAYGGSTAATHADGALVTVNPKFSAFHVLNRINDDLDDLSANGLFAIETDVLTYSSAIQGYELTPTASVIEVLQVKYDEPGPGKFWPEITNYKLRRASDTDDFSSGLAIVLYEGGQDGSPVRVTYAAPFTHLSALNTAISTSGLPTTAYDLPPLGAAQRLQAFREGQRNFNEAQPAPRRSSEVPPGAQFQAVRGLQQIRRDRIRVEASRLRKAWPTRKRIAS